MSPIKTLLIGCLISTTAYAAPPTAPLTLPQAIDYALVNNPELNIMQSRIEQAQNQLGLAMANYYPQVKLGLSYQHSDNPAEAFAMVIAQRRLDFAGTDFNHPGGVDNYRPQITASYSLYRGGQDTHQAQAAELGIETSELEKSAVRNRLVSNITAAYYGQLAAVDAHAVSQRSVEAVQSELQQSQFRYQAGTVLKSDVLSLQVQVAEAKEADIQTANAIEMANTMLKTLLGMSADEPLPIKETLAQALPKTPAKFSTLLTQALTQHPELQAAEKRVAIAGQQLAAAKGAYLPRADAYVSYGSNSNNLEYSTNRDNVSVGVQVEVDVFNGFATQEKVKKAGHELAVAQEAARQSRLQIENELKSAQLKLQEALNRADVAAVSVQAAEEALRLINEQRQAGVVTVTRYIEAEVARDKAHTRQISARFDALRADAELKQATGYWQ
ncbi:MAG: TolC family protein [Methylovulum sp.]|nr:TolC family protein [Methylovulum sp.]